MPTGIAAAHAAGLTGLGVKLAVLDSAHANDYAPLQGRVRGEKDFTGAADDAGAAKSGHGSLMAALAAGNASAGFSGGAAPDAELYMGRVCANDACSSADITRAVQHYTAQQVRLFNLSLGTTGSATTAGSYQEMASSILAADALLVAAAGNAGRNQPDNPAALPAYMPEYRNNWLAVGNVRLDREGNATGLNPLSNACGDAAGFCLVAPGLHQITPVPGTAFAGSQHADGTSASAAAVSGAAALVWQAFPWMSASNVQQSLLTTAKDLGSPGVDATYGWGMLDASRAVRGPGALTGLFQAAIPEGQQAAFGNDISGSGSLLKQGAGSLALLGNNTYTGLTMVQAGNLRLAGNVAGDVDVADGAGLQADGGRIGGNLSLAATATTSVALGNPLDVAGTASLAGTVHLLPAAAGYTVASSETLLTAGAIQGQFGHVTYANNLFWQAELEQGSQAVTARMTRTSATVSTQSLAAPAAVVQGASQADALVGVLDARASAGQLDNLPVADSTAALLHADQTLAMQSLASLSAPLLGAEHAVSAAQALGNTQSLIDRLLREDASARGMFVTARHADGSEHIDGYGGADWRSSGLLGGIRMPVEGASASWGLALSRDEQRLTAIGSDRSETMQAQASAWWLHQGSAVHTGIVGSIGRAKVENRRQLQVGSLAEQLHSQRTDHHAQLRLDATWRPGGIVQPYLAAGVLHLRQGGFDEASATGLGLKAASQSHTLPYLEGGLRLQWQGERAAVGSTLSWQRLTHDGKLDYRAHFDGLEQAGFRIDGLSLPAERLRLGIHARWQLSPRLSLHTELSGEHAAGRGRYTAAELGLDWRF